MKSTWGGMTSGTWWRQQNGMRMKQEKMKQAGLNILWKGAEERTTQGDGGDGRTTFQRKWQNQEL